MPGIELMEKLAAHVDRLPPMPPNVIKLREAVADPNVNYGRIVPLLKGDPSICADILKISNSARYGVGHNVETIEEAVRYFGMPSLVEFVAAACSERIIKQSFSKIGNLNEYLVHSRTVSRASSFVCEALRLDAHSQEVFSISGLLHDIGRLVIILVSGERSYSREFIGVSWDEVSDEIASENDLYGLNHAELGMKICSRWKFPDRIVKAVHRHHTPQTGDDFSFEGMVIFLAEVISIDELPDGVIVKAMPPELMKKVGLTGDALLSARRKFQQSSMES